MFLHSHALLVPNRIAKDPNPARTKAMMNSLRKKGAERTRRELIRKNAMMIRERMNKTLPIILANLQIFTILLSLR